jgi:arsenite methyltransferase
MEKCFFFLYISIVFEFSKKESSMEKITVDKVRRVARERYGSIAEAAVPGGCGCGAGACCGPATVAAEDRSTILGYSREDLESVPAGVNMGLGCGNPRAIASLKSGETVLDLGSGGGLDCFLAAREVGEAGTVIGVDMTPEMLAKARDNATKVGAGNVEFRLGEIEHLPVEDNSVDVILSNCVINLSPEKPKVFREAFRVLKAGGRLAVSDVVASLPLPEEVRQDLSLVVACVGGAETIETLQSMLEEAGFQQISITPMEESRRFIRDWFPGRAIEDYVVSASIEAIKPGRASVEAGSSVPRAETAATHEIKRNAYGLFRSGYLCAEVISTTVLGAFGHRPPGAVTRCASAFCGGVWGTSQELCGAFTGGVLAVGYFLGREGPGENLGVCGDLIQELRKEFLAEFGSLNCSTLLDGFAKLENPQMGCVQLTARAAQILVDLLVQAEKVKGIDLGSFLSQPRGKVELGCCPFSEDVLRKRVITVGDV